MINKRLAGCSIKHICRETELSRNTVKDYLRKIDRSGISLQELSRMDDEALSTYCWEHKPSQHSCELKELHSRFSDYEDDLRKTGVTRRLLWEEYRQNNINGFGYTRFCYYLNLWLKRNDVTARFFHFTGEKLMVDFAGKRLSYVDIETGELIECEVFVAVMPYSSYTYVEAVASQKQEDFVKALGNTFVFMGGIPKCVLSDNMWLFTKDTGTSMVIPQSKSTCHKTTFIIMNNWYGMRNTLKNKL